MSVLRNILLDRDGTIIRDRHYLCRPEQIEILPGAAKSLRLLSEAGFRLFVLSNQSGIGRGYFTVADQERVQAELAQMLGRFGVTFRAQVYCPHAPQEGCTCRKPRTGMWSRLQREFGLRPEQSLVVGDKISDVRFGKNAGLSWSVLVLTGNGEQEALRHGIPQPNGGWREESVSGPPDRPNVIARDLEAVCTWLLQG